MTIHLSSMMFIVLIAVILVTSTYSREFPYREFFKFGKVDLSGENMRKSDFLCSASASWPPLCSCDKDCMKYQSCCIDFMWDKSANYSLAVYMRLFIVESRRYKQMKCTPIVSGLEDKDHTTQSLLMVSKCPKYVSKTIRHKCKQTKLDLNLLPVIGSDDYIYKNKYCAMCNRVDQFEYVKVKADCDGQITHNDTNSKPKSKLDVFSECKIDIAKDPRVEKVVKYCQREVVSKCTRIMADGPKNIDCRICKYYNAGVKTSSARCCKNPHCCRDEIPPNNGNMTEQPDICFEVFPNTARGGIMATRFGESPLPNYSILLTYKESKDFQDAIDSEGACKEDPTSPECEEEYACPGGYTLVDSNCVLDIPRDVVVSRIDAPRPGSRKCFDRFVYMFISAGEREHASILNHINTTLPHMVESVIYQNQSILVVKILESNYVNVTLHMKGDIEYEIIQTSVPDIAPNVIYGMDVSRIFNNLRVCAAPLIHEKGQFNITDDCAVSLDKSKLDKKDYVLYSRIDSQSNPFLVTCEKFHQSAPCVLRSIRNFTLLPNSSIETWSNRTYQPEEYYPMRESIGVCVPKSVSRLWLKIVNAVEGYLTVIGCALSIIAYAWTIITYSLIRELRTTPGKNIICLCSMLLCCDALMLLSMVTAWCQYVAILLHFFALSAQFWSVITAFDIWATFQGKSLSRNIKSNKRFICYCLWGWISPLCFVVLCIALESANVVEVGYGKYGVCWITNFTARLVTYLIPVAVSILFTVTVLTFTMYRIFRQCKKSKTLLKKSGGDNVSLAVMALKLVILLGAIEIIGFLQFKGDYNEKSLNWIFTSIFSLIYIVMRSFRGVFVWLLYVVTDRVFRLYRNIRDQRSYRSTTTKLTPVRRTNPRRSYSTRSSEHFNTTLTIAPAPI